MPVASYARHVLNAVRRSRVGFRAALTTTVLLLGNQGLETAVANGDTRTLSLHHIHTNLDITITYKRNGRYDEEALKKLDWFVRDWRQEEEIHMDPQLFDLIWEVSREVGGDSTIHVVCGYRTPGTNAMLRRRSSGVAQFSQHTLGKAMDLYIPGASLEELRNAGLRMQRGGVGYYPSSGSPFVHLDVGGIRYWPRMSREQLARVFPDGRTVYLPSDGRPLAGYALALGDIEKRGSGASTAGGQKKNLLAALFSKADEEEDAEPAKAPLGARAGGAAVVAVAQTLSGAAPDRAAFTLASSSGTSDAERAITASRVPVPTARPTARSVALAQAAITPVDPNVTGSTVAGTAVTARAMAGTAMAGGVTGRAVSADVVALPTRKADNDRVPLDVLMAYAQQPRSAEIAPTPRPQPIGEPAARSQSELATRSQSIGDPAARSQSVAGMATRSQSIGEPATRGFAETVKLASVRTITTVARKGVVRAATFAAASSSASATAALAAPRDQAEPLRHVAPASVIADAGMDYDDPWLRAVILTPSLSASMTTILYGEPDMTELRALMNKPATAVAMSFDEDPYPGISAAHFTGEAVVFLSILAFEHRTASLR